MIAPFLLENLRDTIRTGGDVEPGHLDYAAEAASELLAVRQLVKEYLSAEREASSQPCLNRYRGAVRTREIARRNRKWHELHDQLSKAVGWTS